MPATNVNGHTIDVSINRLSGKEHVLYDGQDMSSVRNLAATGKHSFTVTEDGESPAYEVDTKNRGFSSEVSAIRRNGANVYP